MFNSPSSYQSLHNEEGSSLNHSYVSEDAEKLDTRIVEDKAVVKYTKYFYFVALISSIMLVVNSLTSSGSSLTAKMTSFIYNNKASTYEIDVKVTSGSYGEYPSLSYLPWDAVVEPYRDQEFSIDSFTIDGESVSIDDDYSVEWTINDVTYTGSSVTVMLESTGVYTSTVSITPLTTSKYYGKRLLSGESRITPKQKLNKNKKSPVKVQSNYESSSYELSFTMAVKYVRREIRDITDSDRTSFFSAIKTLYSVSQSEGQELYGSKYQSAETLSAIHLLGGAMTDCDHFHDGAGIATTHVSFTLYFEQSIQSVDPKVALPYWEYTLDNYLYNSSSDSVIWGKDWFGEMSSGNDDHTLSDNSFWANITVSEGSAYQDWDIASTGSLNPYVNAYNQLRTPWNNEETMKLLREDTLYGTDYYSAYPTCSTLYTAFSQTSLSEMNSYLNGQTHGPTHIYIGGAWVNDESLKDYSDLAQASKILNFKILWRMGYTRCPSSCSPGDSCKCSVPDEYIEQYGAETLLKNSTVYYHLDLNSGEDSSYYLGYLRALENSGSAGDMFSSNAAFDPVFWTVHGSMERLLGLKRILIEQGYVTDFDETWGYPSYDASAGDAYLEGSCDWSALSSSEDLTLPTCDTSVICSGHNEDDELPFGNFLGKGESYTNIEFYEFMNPWNDDLPYVYSTYDYDYCDTYDDVDFWADIDS